METPRALAIFATVEILYVVQGGEGGTRGVIRPPAQSDDWANSYDAVGGGFEPPIPCGIVVFETTPFGLSGIPPANFRTITLYDTPFLPQNQSFLQRPYSFIKPLRMYGI